MRVPGLIHAADDACTPSRTQPLLPLMEKIRALEDVLQDWLRQSPLSIDDDEETPATSTVSVHTSLQPSLARLEKVFGHVPQSPSSAVANTYILYWTGLLLLQMSLLHLINTAVSRGDLTALDAVSERSLKSQSIATATMLCRSIPFLLREAGGNVSQAAAVRGPLYFAQMCFSSTRSILQLRCVQEAEDASREHFRSLNWDALLPWTFLGLIWQHERLEQTRSWSEQDGTGGG